MKASDYIAEFLIEQGVQRVYEMCGGMITHLLDSLAMRDEIRVVSMHHEQAAGFAAEAEARVTGIPGVAMATSGPGATNLMTAIGSCYFDSVPAVFITGQVNTFEQRGESGVRQSGFQETDIVALVEPITKTSWRVQSAGELPDLMREAFHTALEGRPGPVLLDIPMDVQRDDVDVKPLTRVTPGLVPVPAGAVERVLEALARADRPLILAGGGVRSARATRAVRDISRLLDLPVVNSLPAVDVLAGDDPLRVGLIGTYGNRWANEALGESDFVLALGSRLDVRQTGADVESFVQGKTIVRVDVDPAEVCFRISASLSVESDLRTFLSELLDGAKPGADRSVWRARIKELRTAAPDEAELVDMLGINPAEFMHALSRVAEQASAFIADVGQNQIWSAQSLRLTSGQRFLTSAGMGAMGFSLPAAVGAALSTPGRPVVALMGDGGAQVNSQELESIVRLGLPVKCVVLDNGCLGMVRQFQDEYFDSRHQSTVDGYGAPNFVRIAEAYGVAAHDVGTPEQVPDAVAWLMSEPSRAALLRVRLDPASRVRPKVSFGRPIFEMDPRPRLSVRGTQRSRM